MKKIFRFILIAAVVSSSLSAQEKLTLERCLILARTQNPRMRVSQNAVRAAKLSHDELLTSKLPQVKFNATTMYAPSSGNFGYDPAISNGGQYSGQVIVQQPVYDGGVRELKSEQLSLDMDRLAKEQRMAERDIVFAVKQAFIEVLRTDQEIMLQQESVGQLQEYLHLVQNLSNAGNASYTDVLKTQLQLSTAKLSYQQASDEYAVAKYALAELIGIQVDTSFSIDGSLNNSYTVIDSSLVNIVPDSTTNLELSAASLAMKHSLLDVEMTRHENYPTVSLVGDAGLLTSGDNLRLPGDQRSPMWGFSVGLTLELPLINWGAKDLRIQQRALDAENLQIQSDLLQRSLTGESKKTWLQYIKQRERLRSIHANLRAAEENYLLTKSKYAGGGTLSLEVLTAQQLLTDTKLSELQTLADLQLLAAKMEQLTTR